MAGDTAGCRRTCQDIWDRYGTRMRDDPTYQSLVQYVAAAERTGSHAPELVSLARKFTEKPNAPPVHLYLLALSQYRAGQFKDALQSCDRFVAAWQTGAPPPEAPALLALIHHQLGHEEDARQALDRADTWLLQQTGSKTDPARWLRKLNSTDALLFLLLHDEAHQRLHP